MDDNKKKGLPVWGRIVLRIGLYSLLGPIIGEVLGQASDLVDMADAIDTTDIGGD